MSLQKGFLISLIFLSFVDLFVAEDGGYHVSVTNATWNGIEDVCSVGAPAFEFDSGKYVVQFDNLTDIDYNGVWVGYFETMESFSYIGCQDKVHRSSDWISSGSPGQCFRQCGYGTYFGLMHSECFCFQEDFVSLSASKSNCSSPCKYQPDVVCGDTGKVSVYKFNSYARQNEAKPKQNDLFCLQANPINSSYSWANCSDSLALVCDFNDVGTILFTNPPPFETWISSADKCQSEKGLLIPASNNLKINIKGVKTPIWTRIIRSPVIYHIGSIEKIGGKVSTEDKSSLIRYGIVTKRDDQYIMTFTEHNWNRKVLCSQVFKESESLVADIVTGVSVPIGFLITGAVVIFLVKRCGNKRVLKQILPVSSRMSDRQSNVYDLPTMPNSSRHLDASDLFFSLKKLNCRTKQKNKTASPTEPVPIHHYFVLQKLNNDDICAAQQSTCIDSLPNHGVQNHRKDKNTYETIDDMLFNDSDSGIPVCEIEKAEQAYDKCYRANNDEYDHICSAGPNVSWKPDRTYYTTCKGIGSNA